MAVSHRPSLAVLQMRHAFDRGVAPELSAVLEAEYSQPTCSARGDHKIVDGTAERADFRFNIKSGGGMRMCDHSLNLCTPNVAVVQLPLIGVAFDNALDSWAILELDAVDSRWEFDLLKEMSSFEKLFPGGSVCLVAALKTKAGVAVAVAANGARRFEAGSQDITHLLLTARSIAHLDTQRSQDAVIPAGLAPCCQ